MHKITKGLKKKKKGKKSKRGEEDLFKPEELENYRREHQGTSEEPAAQNEEWRKFIALTSEVDDILKKTQGDLNRIKSTSFFQRKPTESEVRKVEEEHQKEVDEQRRVEEHRREEPTRPTGIVEISESESEEEEDDTVFDTAYIDAIATGEVKLAYIPESPTEQQDDDDPFDTSYAERAILGPEVQRKGRKLVPLGAAVEVLTGRVQLPTCATKRPSPKRQVLKERNLLLGSFDETSNLEAEGTDTVTEEVQKTLLDDDSIPLPDEPIDLSKSIIPPQPPRPVTPVERSRDAIVKEFEEVKDEEDLEFEELAAESLAKGGTNVVQDLNIGFVVHSGQWDAKFDNSLNEETEAVEDDPFDTTFAEPILPVGKLPKIKPVSNLLINEDRIPERELNLIKPTDRDLLGGSNVDLSTAARFTQIEPADPFEIIDTKTSPDLDDDDFDPRAIEKPRERAVSRPDVLNITGSKTVSFDVPSPDGLLRADPSRVIKPLTPFYTRKNSVPELPDAEEDDPFDTSFAVNLAPGKAELKVIESELFDPNIEKSFSLVDRNFDPRDERRAKIDRVLNSVNEVVKVEGLSRSVDLLDIDDDISVKVLTPADFGNEIEELSYRDPFDTSAISTNILPGKTELKLLESELIFSDIAQVRSAEKNQCVDNLLLEGDDLVIEQPLNPIEGFQNRSVENQEDFDPFDTSGVANIQPGPVELKILASEFIKN